ncbi:MAG: ABC transporter permease subunit, partial [Gammaproteobacteria bacterium]|nr:ABC transporter permease subunit [Gammaproteobacteria bacterium]
MFDLVLNYSDKLLAGAAMTVQLTLVSVSLAALMALPLALVRHQQHTLMRYPIRFYVSFFRGTPLIAQLFLVYYGSGQFRHELSDLGLWWLFRDPLYCALLTFTLNSAAYQIEILRGALNAVSKGEVEAGRSMGMKAHLLYRRIILPHAYRIA